MLLERTVNTAEWTHRDVALLLALEDFERSLCDGCRDDLATTTDPANDGNYQVDDPVRCHRCTAIQQKAELYADSPQSGALMFPSRLRKPTP